MQEVVKTKECVVRLIETYEESKKYGKDGGWCTAKNIIDWDHYANRGNIWILSKGRRPKYQIFVVEDQNHIEIRGRGNKSALPNEIIEKYPSTKKFIQGILTSSDGITEPNSDSNTLIGGANRNNQSARVISIDRLDITPNHIIMSDYFRPNGKIIVDGVDVYMQRDVLSHGYTIHAARFVNRTSYSQQKTFNQSYVIDEKELFETNNCVLGGTIKALVDMINRKYIAYKLQMQYRHNFIRDRI